MTIKYTIKCFFNFVENSWYLLDLVHNYNILYLLEYKIHFYLCVYLTFVLHLKNNVIKIVDKIKGYVPSLLNILKIRYIFNIKEEITYGKIIEELINTLTDDQFLEFYEKIK